METQHKAVAAVPGGTAPVGVLSHGTPYDPQPAWSAMHLGYRFDTAPHELGVAFAPGDASRNPTVHLETWSDSSEGLGDFTAIQGTETEASNSPVAASVSDASAEMPWVEGGEVQFEASPYTGSPSRASDTDSETASASTDSHHDFVDGKNSYFSSGYVGSYDTAWEDEGMVDAPAAWPPAELAAWPPAELGPVSSSGNTRIDKEPASQAPTRAPAGGHGARISLSVQSPTPRTPIEVSSRTSDRAEQIERAMVHITERATTKEQRQQVWCWAEMLLTADDYEFMSRPLIMTRRYGVFRDDTPGTRRTQQSPAQKPDKWINSGGKKGASQWPLHGSRPRLRCQYGKVLPQGDRSQPSLRYQLYTFIESANVSKHQSRRLYVVFPSNDEISENDSEASGSTADTTDTTVPASGIMSEAQGLAARIDNLIARLEDQARSTSGEIDCESISNLLLLLSEQPEATEALKTGRYERPDVLQHPPLRCIYAEVCAGKRRTNARRHAAHNRGSAFDKWLNAGGKRAVVNIRTASGVDLQRRAGRVSRPDDEDELSGVDLRYHQYTIQLRVAAQDDNTSTTAASRSPQSVKATVFHVYDKSRTSSKLAADVAQVNKTERKVQVQHTRTIKRPEEMMLALDASHQRKRHKKQHSAAAVGMLGFAVVLCVGAILAFGGTGSSTDPGSFNLGKCPHGFFMSDPYASASEIGDQCFPRAEETVCVQYDDQIQHTIESELACVEKCASMGTDACNAMSYNQRERMCRTFRSCARTETQTNAVSGNLLGWNTVWLRAADQPTVQKMDGRGSDQWSVRCYQLVSTVAKQPMDPRCVRCNDCGGDYNMLLPCTSTSNAVCYPREESWDHVTGAKVSAGQFSKELEALSPPQYATTWQTDAAIYAFGGSDSYWPDSTAASVSDETVQQYRSTVRITNAMWRLDRSRVPHVAPTWTRITLNGTPDVLERRGRNEQLTEAIWPAGRTAAASWPVGRDSGMIFSGQFDLHTNFDGIFNPAPLGSFFVPPNSLFRFDEEGTRWRLLGGLDTWQLLQKPEVASIFSNGYMETSLVPSRKSAVSTASKRWPLPRSATQTFSLDGLAYMFSGLFQMTNATALAHSGQSPYLLSGNQTKSFLLNDFWVFDPNTDYQVAKQIAQCAFVVEHPEIMPRASAYPGPRRGAATWSASVDTQSSHQDRATWMSRGWMFGGVGRRISTSGTAVPAHPGIAKPQAGGAHSCIAEQLDDDGNSSPEVAQVTNLCDLWAFSKRDGWNIVYACSRDARMLYEAGLTTVGSTVVGSTPTFIPMESWASASPQAPTASLLSTTWVEYDWRWSVDTKNRGAPTRAHAETILRMFGGVTRCASRKLRTLDLIDSNTSERRKLFRRLANYTMCDVVDRQTDAVLQPATSPECSSELWSFSTLAQAWTRTDAPTTATAGQFRASPPESLLDDDKDPIDWPPAHCGAYSISGPIPPWHGFASDYANGIPMYPSQVDDYQATEDVNVRGRSSILLAGGFNGSSEGHCTAPPTTKFCFAADEMWRWEAPRSAVTAP